MDPPLTITEFGTAMRYPDLGRLLSAVRAGDLARSDVIAFDLQNLGGGAGIENGWESSVWTFSDGVNTRIVTFNECLGAARSDPRIVATGSIRSSAYKSFFGMCSAGSIDPWVSYILFDLHSIKPAIDIGNRSFSIRIENNYVGASPECVRHIPPLSGEGSPDVDAVGIFSACSRR